MNEKIECFFSSENQLRIQGELQYLGYKYQEYIDYQINPYEDNLPCSYEDEVYCYDPILKKAKIFKPDEKEFCNTITKLLLTVNETSSVWSELSMERQKILKNLAIHIVAKYQEIFGKSPDFITTQFG